MLRRHPTPTLFPYTTLFRSGYFLVGGDADDIEQEALIGLYKAARDFRPEHQASFRAFAELCITRQIITAIKTRSEEHTSELQSRRDLVCRLLLEKKK